MHNILYAYTGENNLLQINEIYIKGVNFLEFFNSSMISERNYFTLYKKIEEDLNKSEGLIIDKNFLVNEMEIFEFAVYLRLMKGENWDLPIYIFINSSQKSFYEFVKSDFTNVSKTIRFDIINSTEFEKDSFSGEANFIHNFKRKTSEKLEWSSFLKTIEINDKQTDNHSIANKWGIYRWSKTIILEEDEAILDLIKKVDEDIYFKYLQAIYPVSQDLQISDNILKIEYTGNPKILYIDDDAEKGWYEIMCQLIFSKNNIKDFYYLSDELKLKSRDEIVKLCVEKIKNDDIDVVILDFRLHKIDTSTSNIKQITGYQILEIIKEKINPGIQVIIFSATNKIWNLQAIQDAGGDGFVLKERPENSVDQNFTKDSILSFRKILEERLQMTFLKDFYNDYRFIENLLIPRRNYKNQNPLPKKFVDEVLKWLKLSNDIISKGKCNDANLMSSFLFKFSVLENLANRIIDVDTPIYIGKDDKNRNKYEFEFRNSNTKLVNFHEDDNVSGIYHRTDDIFSSNRSLPWSIKILNTLDYISDKRFDQEKLNKVIKKRNDFIHSNSTTGDKSTVDNKDIIFLHQLIVTGLQNVV